MKIGLTEAIAKLNAGELVAIPTETVYGLAARYDKPEAVAKVFKVKGRPAKNPLIMHIADSETLAKFVETDLPHLQKLIESFWPGPLTLVLPLKELRLVPAIVRADLPTQAFRMPAHPLTLQLIKETAPLVAPSANLSGKPSAVTPEHVETDFGPELPILDGGITEKGVESTILLFFDNLWHLGRFGAIPVEAFAKILGYIPQELKLEEQPLCPGQLLRHYAPQASLELKTQFEAKEVIIGFSDRKYPDGTHLISLGPSHNPEIVLHHLYSALRELDKRGVQHASIDINVPQIGLWKTYLERVQKSAQG